MQLEIKATYNDKELVMVIPDFKKDFLISYVQSFHRKLDELTNTK